MPSQHFHGITWHSEIMETSKPFPGSLNDIMTEAIVDDKVGFVRLLLQNGVCMDEYLTPPMLRVLYNKVRQEGK